MEGQQPGEAARAASARPSSQPAAASTQAFGLLRLLVDPRAGKPVRQALPRLRAALEQRGVAHEVVTAAKAQPVESLARTAASEDGVRFLAAVGDDRTVHEALNGLFPGGAALAPDLVLGVVAAGAATDFAANFGLDRPPEMLAGHLASAHEMPIDVGTVSCTGPDGRPSRRVFANVAQVGYAAEAVRRRARLPRALGRVGDLLAAYGAIARLRRQVTQVSVAHTTAELPVVNLVVANCQFVSRGMKIAPRALPDDGRFNVQVFTGERSQVFLLTQRIFRGEHLPHPNITEWQSPSVALAPPEPLAVEADGQLLGRTPVEFGLLERALRLKI